MLKGIIEPIFYSTFCNFAVKFFCQEYDLVNCFAISILGDEVNSHKTAKKTKGLLKRLNIVGVLNKRIGHSEIEDSQVQGSNFLLFFYYHFFSSVYEIRGASSFQFIDLTNTFQLKYDLLTLPRIGKAVPMTTFNNGVQVSCFHSLNFLILLI